MEPIEVKRAIAIQHILSHMMGTDASPPHMTGTRMSGANTSASSSPDKNEADMSIVRNVIVPLHTLQKPRPPTNPEMDKLLKKMPAPNANVSLATNPDNVMDVPLVTNVVLNDVVVDNTSKVSQEHKRKNYGVSDIVKVWKSVFGDNMTGVCKLCNVTQLSLETRSGAGAWEMSHLTSHSDGGGNELDNMRPLCRSCNRAMGKTEFKAFAFQQYPERYDEILTIFKIE